jgi:hypothetical protein
VDSPMSEAELRLLCSGPLSQAFRYCFMVKPGIDIELTLMLEWSQSRLFDAHAQRVYSPMLGRLSEPAAFCSGSGGGVGVLFGVDVVINGRSRRRRRRECWYACERWSVLF